MALIDSLVEHDHACNGETLADTITGSRPALYSHGSYADGNETDAIAVIGFSLKFPQEATNAESFWNLLDEGRSAMTEFPKDRLNIDAFYHPDSSRRGTVRLDALGLSKVTEIDVR